MNKKNIIFVAIISFLVVVISVSVVLWRKEFEKKDFKYTGPIEKVVIADKKSILNIVAQEKGFFKENGLDAQITEIASGLSGIDDLLRGKVDIAPATDFVVANKIYNNKNLRILAQLFRGGGLSIVARKDRGVSIPSDLKGKMIGVVKQTIAEFYLGQFLIDNNLFLKDVKIIDLSVPEMISRIKKKQIDAVVVWDPYIYTLQKDLGNDVVMWSSQNGLKFFFLSCATDEFIKTHPVIIERYLRTMIQTAQYIKDNAADTKDIVAKSFQNDVGYMEYIWPTYDFGIRLDQALLPQLESEARFVIMNKITDQTNVPNYLDFIYFDALEKVKPEAITILR